MVLSYKYWDPAVAGATGALVGASRVAIVIPLSAPARP
jgi:hypothetical protein